MENLEKVLKYKKLECYETHKTEPQKYLDCAMNLNKIIEDNKLFFGSY